MLRRLPLLLAALLLATAGPLAAQAVRVTVADAGTGAPLADALVRLEDAAGEPVRSLFTGDGGVAALRVPAGEYTVRVQRAGYLPAETRVRVGAGRTDARVELRARPFSLDTLRVVAPGGEERGRDAFARRMQTERGVFLDPAYMAQRYRGAMYLADLLADAPGVGVEVMRRSGRRVVVNRRGWECMHVIVNGGAYRSPPPHVDAWIEPRDIVAVEIYHIGSEVPREYARYSWEQTTGPSARPCGLLIYWTREAW